MKSNRLFLGAFVIGVALLFLKVDFAFGGPLKANSFELQVMQNKGLSFSLRGSGGVGPLTFAIVLQPTNGRLYGKPPAMGYIPNLNFHGVDTFMFSVSDGVRTSKTTAFIEVVHVNQAPSTYNQSFTVFVGQSVVLPLAASDPDGDRLTYLISAPKFGFASALEDKHAFFYVPKEEGQDSFRFVVSDGQLYSQVAYANITVKSHIQPSQRALDFGFVTPDQMVQKILILQSIHPGMTVVDYQVTDHAFSMSDDCLNQRLGYNQSCSMRVSFSPRAAGEAEGKLIVIYSDSDNRRYSTTVALSGNGVEVAIPGSKNPSPIVGQGEPVGGQPAPISQRYVR